MISGKIHACWHPAGVRVDQDRIPGVSLRSPPGYFLSSLPDEKRDYHLGMVLQVSGIVKDSLRSSFGNLSQVPQDYRSSDAQSGG
jgi:hypothetical protein